MKTIWKYRLAPDNYQITGMPVGAEILTLQMQDGEPHLWVLVDKDIADRETRKVFMVGTGFDAPEDIGRCVGTFQMDNDEVFHVFEEKVRGKG